MAGIYILIPFCKKACIYCNFHFSTSLRLKEPLIQAINKEITERHKYLNNRRLDSIYFGGGTPSLMKVSDIESILNTITKYFDWDENTEITLEANPDDLDLLKIKEYVSLGINRMSIGVQSFFNEDLKFMTRAHNSEQAIRSLIDAQNAGITNLNIDLIYGCPTTSESMWEANLEKVNRYEIPHISAYALTVEERTALHHNVLKKKVFMPDDERVLSQFEMLMDFAQTYKYEHYEISNFAKEGKYAIHNTNYWNSAPYLGIGPSAHSYDGDSRSWNIANNALYIKYIQEGMPFYESEQINTPTRFNEHILTRLRTQWGVDIKKISTEFGLNYSRHFIKNAEKYIASGHLAINDNICILTKSGKFLADKITADLFCDWE